MNEDATSGRRRLLKSVEELASLTDRIQPPATRERANIVVVRDALEQVHAAIYAIHLRLDALDDRWRSRDSGK